MKEYISLDCHKHYSLMERFEPSTGQRRQQRIAHARGAITAALSGVARGTAVAVEATGNWYWIVAEIEAAGLQPLLVHPRKAKLMMGMINKTDSLDVHGLNVLQQNATLPVVWIPPSSLRDLRELTRVRMVLSAQRTRLKNRVTALLAKHGLVVKASDPYGTKGRCEMEGLLETLPPHSAWAARLQLKQLDSVMEQLRAQEQKLRELLAVTPQMQRLTTLPGVGLILSAVIALEIGEIGRFGGAPQLASYSGTTPRVMASGGRVRYGSLRNDVNQYLKWAFAEAGNSVAVNHTRCPERHVSRLYRRIRERKGHAKAIGAVARHLAEAAYWVLSKNEAYRERSLQQGRTEAGVSANVS
jgi:transposase